MKNKYFNQALSNVMYETACKGAIRHYVRLGYSAIKIMNELDFPMSYLHVQEMYTDCLLEAHILFIHDPWEAADENPVFAKEQDAYGHVSFRKVSTTKPKSKKTDWKCETLNTGDRGEYQKKLEESMQRQTAYVRCFFTDGKSVDEKLHEYLTREQMEYLFGIQWLKGIRYHWLNERLYHILLAIPPEYKQEVELIKTKVKMIPF